MTQLEYAKQGKITPEMELVAQLEGVSPEFIRTGIARGEIVLPFNNRYRIEKPVAIGKGVRTKVNANIGSSTDVADLELELAKVRAAIDAGADTIMDLSTGNDIGEFRRAIRKAFPGPMGTVPIYEAAIEAAKQHGGIIFMTPDLIFDVIERHAKDGVDFITVHAGVTFAALDRLRATGRVTDIVSRGATFLLVWMLKNKEENPLYTQFDRLLEIAREYDLTLSLGDGFRPGSIADSTDAAQIHELMTLGELQQRALKAGVQVMIEGPGHIPIHMVAENVKLEKQLCHNAPFYVLGPVVTDIAPGYDHITAGIGAAIAAAAGADFICYVTPSEHLALPTPDEVYEGVIAARIAAHAGDIAKGVKGAYDWDLRMSQARKKLDWNKMAELAIDPTKVRKRRAESLPAVPDVCTMCGKYCAIKLLMDVLNPKSNK